MFACLILQRIKRKNHQINSVLCTHRKLQPGGGPQHTHGTQFPNWPNSVHSCPWDAWGQMWDDSISVFFLAWPACPAAILADGTRCEGSSVSYPQQQHWLCRVTAKDAKRNPGENINPTSTDSCTTFGRGDPFCLSICAGLSGVEMFSGVIVRASANRAGWCWPLSTPEGVTGHQNRDIRTRVNMAASDITNQEQNNTI